MSRAGMRCDDVRQVTDAAIAHNRPSGRSRNLNPFGGEGAVENEATGHGAQKPVEIMRRPILNHTRPGEVCYDPFLGSGSTLIAAESTGRICYGMEIDAKFVRARAPG